VRPLDIRCQVIESSAHLGRVVPVADGREEHGDDVAVTTEVGEVGEGEVDRTRDGTGAAQAPELVELSLTA
jgi:hypothetical protein